MTALRIAAQQALAFTMRDFATIRDFEAARAVLHDDLRAALKQEEEASAWLAERKEYWRKEKEKMCTFRAALAQQDEPVEPVAWVASEDGRVIYDDTSEDDGLLRVSGDFEDDEQRAHYAQRIVGKLNAALAQQAEPVQEPFGYLWPTGRHPEFRFTQQKRDGVDGMPLYTAPPQHAEPVEPVAWMYRDSWGTMKLSQVTPPPVGAFPVYTAPPQRKPLSNTEMDTALRRAGIVATFEALRCIGRAVERAHGIKE